MGETATPQCRPVPDRRPWRVGQRPGETANRLSAPTDAGVIAELRQDLHATFQRLGAPPLEEGRTNVRQELTVYTR